METKRLSVAVIAWLYFLSSCALLNGYRNNQHAAYYRTLTKAQKVEIDEVDFIELPFVGGFKNHLQKGTLLVIKKKDKYDFVERGLWTEKPLEGVDTVDFVIDRSECYDQYGNIRERKTYANHKRDGMYLYDIWNSEIRVVEGDSILIQHIKRYFTNGRMSHKFCLAVPDYKELRSDYLKTKYRMGKGYEYDTNGSLLDSTTYHLSDSIIKKGYL